MGSHRPGVSRMVAAPDLSSEPVRRPHDAVPLKDGAHSQAEHAQRHQLEGARRSHCTCTVVVEDNKAHPRSARPSIHPHAQSIACTTNCKS